MALINGKNSKLEFDFTTGGTQSDEVEKFGEFSMVVEGNFTGEIVPTVRIGAEGVTVDTTDDSFVKPSGKLFRSPGLGHYFGARTEAGFTGTAKLRIIPGHG